jgi:hypothetical protein
MDRMDRILESQEQMNTSLNSTQTKIQDALDAYKKRSNDEKLRNYDRALTEFERLQRDMNAYTTDINTKMLEVQKNWSENEKIRNHIHQLLIECIKTANESKLESLEGLVRYSLAGIDPATLPLNARTVLTRKYGGGSRRRRTKKH